MSDATNITEIREICREIFDAKDDKKDVLLEENNDGNQARQGTEYSLSFLKKIIYKQLNPQTAGGGGQGQLAHRKSKRLYLWNRMSD